MVLANPGLVEADSVEMHDQVNVAPERECWVLVDRMKGRHEDTAAHPIWPDRGHSTLLVGNDLARGYHGCRRQEAQHPVNGRLPHRSLVNACLLVNDK